MTATVLLVDNYAGGFTRIQAGAITTSPESVTVALATQPGPGGAVFAALGDIPGQAAVWADFNGSLGKLHYNGGDVLGSTLKEWIRRGDLLTVHRDDSDPAHPALAVTAVGAAPDTQAPTTPPSPPARAAREGLAAAITAAAPGIYTYPGTVAAPATPGVLIEGGGFTVVTSCAIAYTVQVTVVGGVQTITEAVDSVEGTALQVYAATVAAGWQVSGCSPPTVVQIGGDGFLACQFTATTRIA